MFGFLSALLVLRFQIIYSAPIGTNFTTTIRVEPEEVKEYLSFFASPIRVKSPLKVLLDAPEELYVLCKAAEFAADSYKGSRGGRRFRLRDILDLDREIGSPAGYKIRLLLQDKHFRSLQDNVFHIGIKKLRTGFYEAEVGFPRPKRSDQLEAVPESSTNKTCDFLSKLANCTSCGYKGICHKGSARVSPWLDFALKTQRELQSSAPFNQYQMLGAHNAFNDRADGYGEMDDCLWPPPYKGECIDLANQEFSFTDLLDMGVRALEIDPWWCFGKMRMSHAHNHAYFGCSPWDREYRDGIQEIAEWINSPGNAGEIVKIYLEDGAAHTKGHDSLINGPIQEHLNDKVLTPNDTENVFKGKWPSISAMRKLDKTVVIATGNSYNHQGVYVHKSYWREMTHNTFESFKNCSAVNRNDLTPVRVYSDSTEYGPFWNGPKQTGTILNYLDFLSCGVVYPAADQVNPHLLETAIFTWADGEPRNALKENSCVLLCAENRSWHVADCVEKHPFACVSVQDEGDWVLSSSPGPYAKAICPRGYEFSVPRNAVHSNKLISIANNTDVWINFTPFIPLVKGRV